MLPPGWEFQLIGWLLTGMVGIMTYLFKKIYESVSDLNKNMAVVVTKLGDHDERIRHLERK